ncbi:MAG TPA: adenine phosphoribosyltransferase [Methylomirabilota bacterium]|nr:adenine phosphoribosyltransferase [Methylomirabilota bacterium]
MSNAPASAATIRNAIRNIPDFPKPGIHFKDITPVLGDAKLFAASIDLLTSSFKPGEVDFVIGIDARGFIFASGAALKWGAGLVPIRKKGKLPYQTHEESYDLEYGSSVLAIHTDAIKPGSRVVLVDDLLATGGTASAAASLVQKLGGNLLEVTFLIELEFLKGRDRLKNAPVRSIVRF